jgi:AI-2 transport protein TqsA
MTDPGAAAEPRWPLPRGLIVVLAATGILVSVLALRQFAEIIGPVLLALVLVVGVHPLTGFLRRRGAPMWLAATTTLLALVLVIFGLAASLALSVAQLAALIPTYQDSFTALVSDLRAWLGSRGMETLMASDTDAPVDLYIAAKNA